MGIDLQYLESWEETREIPDTDQDYKKYEATRSLKIKNGFLVELYSSGNFEGDYEIFENCDKFGPAVESFKVQGLVNTGFIDRGESDVDSIKIKRCPVVIPTPAPAPVVEDPWSVKFYRDEHTSDFIDLQYLAPQIGYRAF